MMIKASIPEIKITMLLLPQANGHLHQQTEIGCFVILLLTNLILMTSLLLLLLLNLLYLLYLLILLLLHLLLHLDILIWTWLRLTESITIDLVVCIQLRVGGGRRVRKERMVVECVRQKRALIFD